MGNTEYLSLALIQHDFIQSPASAVQAEKTGDDVITTRYWLGRIGKASPPSDKKKKAHKEVEKFVSEFEHLVNLAGSRTMPPDEKLIT